MQFDRKFVFKTAEDDLRSAWKSKRVQECLSLCYDAHDGQVRETANSRAKPLPYILHPLGVAILCVKFFNDELLDDDLETVVMAALAHDVLEDTSTTASEISRVCGQRVTELVSILTKPLQEPEESNLERNARFSQRIVDGGSTSAFIKICDSIHNMSRPQQSPVKLMEKAVVKARKDYSTFFSRGLNHPLLKKAYFDQIQVVTTYLANARSLDQQTKRTELGEVLAEAYQARKRKVLERHDLYGFLESQLLVSFARAIRTDELLEMLQGDERKSNQQLKRRVTQLVSDGEVDLSQLPAGVRQTSQFRDVDKLLVFPMERLMSREANVDRKLIMGLKAEISPAWVTRETVGVILGYLSEKIRDHERNEFIELARSAADLGLIVRPEDLENARQSYSDILKLREARQKAEYFGNVFLSELDGRIALSDQLKLPLPIESRVKTPDSVLGKIVRRNLDGIAAVDDLLGIRIICLGDAQKEILKDLCREIASAKCAEIGEDQVLPDFSMVTSRAGYKSDHFGFFWQGIGCEIQVRTVFEDAWARVSGALQYKSAPHGDNVDAVLKELADLRDKSEEAVKKLK